MSLDYGAAETTVDIPWGEFDPSLTGAALPAYDALRIEGVRADHAPLILKTITFYD